VTGPMRPGPREMVRSLRQASTYALGVSDGFALSADAIELDLGLPGEAHAKAEARPDEAAAPNSATRRRVKGPILELLRESLSPIPRKTILDELKKTDQATLATSVSKSLQKLVKQGILRVTPDGFVLERGPDRSEVERPDPEVM
jgi:hypothetical protein